MGGSTLVHLRNEIVQLGSIVVVTGGSMRVPTGPVQTGSSQQVWSRY